MAGKNDKERRGSEIKMVVRFLGSGVQPFIWESKKEKKKEKKKQRKADNKLYKTHS